MRYWAVEVRQIFVWRVRRTALLTCMYTPSFAELTALRKKFEEDKQKIAQLRAARKFRPY
jgi:hypothetical protein